MEPKRSRLKTGKHEFGFGPDTCQNCGVPFQAFVEGATQTCPEKKETVRQWRRNRDSFKIEEVHA